MEEVNEQGKITEQQAIDAIQHAVDKMTPDAAHAKCEDILTDFLRANGYEKLADKFDSVCIEFWYC